MSNIKKCADKFEIESRLGSGTDGAILVEAEEHGIMLLRTSLSSFDAAGRLWQAGLRM